MFRFWLITFLIVTATDARPNHSSEELHNDVSTITEIEDPKGIKNSVDIERSETVDEIIGSPLDITAEDLLPDPVFIDVHDAETEQEPLVAAVPEIDSSQAMYLNVIGQHRSELDDLKEGQVEEVISLDKLTLSADKPTEEEAIEVVNAAEETGVKTPEPLVPFILWDVPETKNADNPLWYIEDTDDQLEKVVPEGRIKLVSVNFGNPPTFPALPTLPTIPTLTSILPTIPTTSEILNTIRQNLITQLELLQGNIDGAIIKLKNQLTPTP